MSSLVLLPWSQPVYTRMPFSLLPRPWGTRLKMRASETSSGQGIPGDQDLLLLSWGYVEGDLNLVILGRMPERHICSDLKPEPKITGRRSTQAAPAGEGRETGHRASGLVREGPRMILRGVLAAQLTPPQPG